MPPALLAATACDMQKRLPLRMDGIEVGSVARGHWAALSAMAERYALRLESGAIVWQGAPVEAELHQLNLELRALGLIHAWRDERYPLVDPQSLRVLTHLERAASRFWGTLTFGAHATGYVAGDDGRPSHLWIATRSPHKATDPGLCDNLVGGGVAAGQTPREALLREAWEEAGLQAQQLTALQAASVLRLRRDIPEGLQHEWLYSFDIKLPASFQPVNQDGEVADFRLMPVAQAIELARSEKMTVDAALVTLDFAHRRGLWLDAGPGAALAALRVVRPD